MSVRDEARAAAESAQAAAAVAAETEARLWSAVWEHPDDDGARLALADFLADRGDPRGEFIRVQHRIHAGEADDAARIRERVLCATHGAAWLGPLHGLVEDAQFLRGFLHAARCAPRHELLDLIGHPLWSTVETLDLGPDVEWLTETALRLVRHPVMRSLRAVRSLPEEAFYQLLPSPLPLTSIAFCGPRSYDDDHRRVIAMTARGLPRLRYLELQHPTAYLDNDRCRPVDFRWLLTSSLARRLERLAIYSGTAGGATGGATGGPGAAGGPALGPWIRELDGGAAQVAAFTLRTDAIDLHLARAADGRMSRLSVALPPGEAPFLALLGALDSVGESQLTHVTVSAPAGVPPALTGEHLRRLRRATARYLRLAEIHLPPPAR